MDDFENKTPEMQEPASSEDNIPVTPDPGPGPDPEPEVDTNLNIAVQVVGWGPVMQHPVID